MIVFLIISKTELKWIINIDYFGKVEEGTYSLQLTDEQILQFCDNLILTMDNIAIITIALNPSCCGGWENSNKVTRLITDKFGLNFALKNISQTMHYIGEIKG